MTTTGILHKLLYSHPTSVWKHLILGLRPAFFGNITVGNSVLGALQMAPGLHGVAGWLNQVLPGAEKMLGPKLTDATMKDVLPEQAGGGTFGGSEGFTSNRGLGLAKKAYQGVMPATIAYENVLRRAMAEGWAKAHPEVRAAMKANGGDVNPALTQVAATHPQVINDISRRIDDALGNYRNYSKFERQIKQLIPFYGWDRHIVRSTGRILSERPATASALTNVGAVGHAQQDQTLGPLPSYMQGDIKLPGLPGVLGPLNGRTPVLNTKSLNPFNTVGDLGNLAAAFVHGKPGSSTSELASGLNPIVQAAIEQMTGRSLLTGGPVKGGNFGLGNVSISVLANLPEVKIAMGLLGKNPATKPGALYQNDTRTIIANYLGLPVKKINPAAAAKQAAQGR